MVQELKQAALQVNGIEKVVAIARHAK